MTNYLEDLSLNYQIEKPTNKVIFQITNLIKYENDYDSAIKLIVEHNIKFETIVSTTIRLTRKQIIKLANKMISMKN